MKKRIIGISCAVAFAIAAIGAPVAAQPQDETHHPSNDNACVGQFISWHATVVGVNPGQSNSGGGRFTAVVRDYCADA
jgi:hypothetical protein